MKIFLPFFFSPRSNTLTDTIHQSSINHFAYHSLSRHTYHISPPPLSCCHTSPPTPSHHFTPPLPFPPLRHPSPTPFAPSPIIQPLIHITNILVLRCVSGGAGLPDGGGERVRDSGQFSGDEVQDPFVCGGFCLRSVLAGFGRAQVLSGRRLR